MLQITGKYLGHSVETIRPREGASWQPFDKTTVSLMVDGPGGRPRIEEVELHKDLVQSLDLDVLERDEDVTFGVEISAFNTRMGGDYRLTATRVLSEAKGFGADDSWPRAVGGSETGY